MESVQNFVKNFWRFYKILKMSVQIRVPIGTTTTTTRKIQLVVCCSCIWILKFWCCVCCIIQLQVVVSSWLYVTKISEKFIVFDTFFAIFGPFWVIFSTRNRPWDQIFLAKLDHFIWFHLRFSFLDQKGHENSQCKQKSMKTSKYVVFSVVFWNFA